MLHVIVVLTLLLAAEAGDLRYFVALCFSLFFPVMGACLAQIKGFTLGCREHGSRKT